MRVLIIGSGGREHALSWKIRRNGHQVWCAPGNGGTAEEGENVAIAENDVPRLVAFAKEKSIDLVIPGPELPLTLGIVDAMHEAGVRCFGPDRECARLEGSKSFAKSVMEQAGVPTAASGVFTDLAAARAFIAHGRLPVVIKADGLAAGKGVVVAHTEEEAFAALEQIMGSRVFGDAGNTVLIEAFLEGEEVSLLAFCAGEIALPLASAQDHKAAFDGDTGPNTGGMGAYSPAPILPDTALEAMTDRVIRPVLGEMSRRGHPFTGILYAGLMMTADGPKVLEYNVRFGDPECQPLLMRLENDPAAVMSAALDGRLGDIKLTFKKEAALGVVIVAEGYPGSYPKGMSLSGIEDAERLAGTKVFQAGTRREGGKLVSSGGRVLCVTALGASLAQAGKHAYEAVNCIHMENSRHRNDIGAKGLKRS